MLSDMKEMIYGESLGVNQWMWSMINPSDILDFLLFYWNYNSNNNQNWNSINKSPYQHYCLDPWQQNTCFFICVQVRSPV